MLLRRGSAATGAGCPPGSAGVSPASLFLQIASHPRHPFTTRKETAFKGVPPILPSPAPLPGSTGNHATRFASAGHTRFTAGGRAGCYIAGKLSRSLRQCMRAGRPRSRVGCLFPLLLLIEGTSAAPPAEGAQRTARDAHPERGRLARICSRHSLALNLLHPGRPASMPRLCFGRARAVPAGGVGGCYVVGILSESLRRCMRARRPRSRVGVSSAVFSAQPGPSPPSGSTGKHATALLWPGSRAFPAGGVGGCYVVGILSESLRQCMRAGRPRSRVGCLSGAGLLRGCRLGGFSFGSFFGEAGGAGDFALGEDPALDTELDHFLDGLEADKDVLADVPANGRGVKFHSDLAGRSGGYVNGFGAVEEPFGAVDLLDDEVLGPRVAKSKSRPDQVSLGGPVEFVDRFVEFRCRIVAPLGVVVFLEDIRVRLGRVVGVQEPLAGLPTSSETSS